MGFDKRLIKLRKEKNLSQAFLAKKVGVHANVMGRYERGEAKPSIDIALKLAKVLEVSLDYLAGKTNEEVNDAILKRVQDISSLSEKDQEHVFSLMDAFIAKAKIQQILK